MKKRLVALVLCIVMMFSLVSVQAFADTGSDGSVSVTTTAKKVEVGKTFDVTIKVTPNGVAAGAVNFTVALSAGLEYVSHQILVSTSDYMMSNYDVATGVFGCAVTTNGKSVAFNVLKLTLKAKDTNVGENSISLTNVTISNVAGDANLNYATTVAPVTVTTSVPVVAVTSVTVSSKTLNLEVGQTRTLTATVTPDNATDKTVTWTSSDKNVATVDKDNGTVTAVGEGTATITATAANGKKDTCKVTVKVPAHKHTPVAVPAQESTCMEKGWEAYYKCSECGAVVDENGNAAQIKYLPLAAHKLTETKAVPATCTEDGTEAYWTCSVCKKMFADKDGKKEIKAPVKVAALGHDIGEKTLETAGVAGSKLALYSATCKTCNKKVYTAMLEMPDNTLNVVAKQSDNSKKDFSKAVSFTLSTSKFLGAPVFTIDPVTADIVTAAKTKAGYKVAGKIDKADYLGAIAYELPNYYDTAEEAYAAMAAFMKDGLTFTQKISAKENTWAADAKSHTMTFDINTADGTFTVKVDGKNESTITFTNTFTYKTVSPGGGGSGSSDTTKTDGKKVESGKTFDAGIAMYVGLSVLSVTGGALVIGKKKERF